MSHITTVEKEIKNLDGAKRAAQALGLGFELGPSPVKYFSGDGPVCDAIIYLPKATKASKYTLGLRLNPKTGCYDLCADEELIGGRSGTDDYGVNDPLRKILGEDCRNFMKEYSCEIIQGTYGPLLAGNPNLRLERTNHPDGSIDFRIYDVTDVEIASTQEMIQDLWQGVA